MPAKKKTEPETELYVIGERSRWLTYREQGEEDDPIQLRADVEEVRAA